MPCRPEPGPEAAEPVPRLFGTRSTSLGKQCRPRVERDCSICAGILPSLFTDVSSAPDRNRRSTAVHKPARFSRQAMCKGVLPWRYRAPKFAPWCKRASMASYPLLDFAERKRGVPPLAVFFSRLAPASINTSITLATSNMAATCSAVRSSSASLIALTSAPCLKMAFRTSTCLF